jgi:hypothetical protein
MSHLRHERARNSARGVWHALGALAACDGDASDRFRTSLTFNSVMGEFTRVPTHSTEYSLACPGEAVFALCAGFFRVDGVGSARLAYARLQQRDGEARASTLVHQ